MPVMFTLLRWLSQIFLRREGLKWPLWWCLLSLLQLGACQCFHCPYPQWLKYRHKNSRSAMDACMCLQTCRMFFFTEATFEVGQVDSILVDDSYSSVRKNDPFMGGLLVLNMTNRYILVTSYPQPLKFVFLGQETFVWRCIILST